MFCSVEAATDDNDKVSDNISEIKKIYIKNKEQK